MRLSLNGAGSLLTTTVVVLLSLGVIGPPPVQAQEQPSAQEFADLRARADAGEADAQHALGFLYSDGLGVPQDYVAAVGWYRQAAEQGHPTAQYALGVMYQHGLGVPENYVEAHIWLNLGASKLTGQSREKAVAARDLLGKLMTPAELRNAHRRAREWHADAPATAGLSDLSSDPSGAGAVGGKVYRLSDVGIVAPRLLAEVPPRYTSDAQDEGIAGKVYVEAVVLPDGTVGDVRITRSLDPVFGLDEEAIKAARQWRFLPGTRFGEPVAIISTIEFEFSLR